ncbi:hypothetical protein L2E82_31330 [Cichorium intybus]|uniref:Uncharacterized protein n=1 Tax=Cichorium intybus TaxID=13427 RepID=A0ACB9D303_CICIN|nr:hypothetical protein L2E82_31330 [Cichorium intybus]
MKLDARIDGPKTSLTGDGCLVVPIGGNKAQRVVSQISRRVVVAGASGRTQKTLSADVVMDTGNTMVDYIAMADEVDHGCRSEIYIDTA